jgi:hypothetical protein
MITGPRSHFIARCVARGYRPADVRACIIREDGDTITVDETHPAYPRPRPGLGDIVAAGLSAVGITPERVSAVIGGPCGCEERKEALNDWGRDHLGIG